MFTTPLCLAIAFYFAEKKNKKLARQKIGLLGEHLSIAAISEATVKKVTKNAAIHDYAALESKCACIITEDRDDFYFSEIEVISAEDFFEKYLTQKSRKKA